MIAAFDDLGTLAAMALRDAVETAIRGLEVEIKREPAKGCAPRLRNILNGSTPSR